jgi:hypothetical protein
MITREVSVTLDLSPSTLNAGKSRSSAFSDWKRRLVDELSEHFRDALLENVRDAIPDR